MRAPCTARRGNNPERADLMAYTRGLVRGKTSTYEVKKINARSLRQGETEENIVLCREQLTGLMSRKWLVYDPAIIRITAEYNHCRKLMLSQFYY